MSMQIDSTNTNISSLDEIKCFIKQNILIERLEIENDSADDIDEQAGLFDPDAIGLDSVEALEIISALEWAYGVSFQGLDEQTIRENFYSVETLSKLVHGLLAGTFHTA